MNRTILSIFALAVTLGANSQELTGEVTVDRTVQPTERDAAPLPLLPRVDLPALRPSTLSISGRGVPTAVNPAVVFSEPTPWNPYSPTTPRGYVAAAIGGPLIDGSLSAGYRILNTKSTALGAWLQYTGSNYKRLGAYWRDNQIAGGLYGTHQFNAVSRLDASVNYTWRRFNLPYVWEHYNTFNLQGAWSSKVDALQYGVDASYNWFGYSYGSDEPDRTPVKQNHFCLGADARLPLDEYSGIELDVDFDLLASSKSFTPGEHVLVDSHTGALLRFTPSYDYKAEKWGFDLGARLDLSFNEGRFFHIAPQARGWWRPADLLAAAVTISGGEVVNPIAELAKNGLSTNAFTVYGFSHVPLAVDAEVTIGPRRSLYATVFGGWARANNWLMGIAAESAMQSVDIKGAHVGLEIGGAFRRLLKGCARFEMAPSDFEKGYYQWRDRARYVVDLAVEAYPISKLTVDAAWQLRAGRASYNVSYLPVPGNLQGSVLVARRQNLHNISDISVGANYSLTEALTVMARGENLLNRRNMSIDGTPAAGWTVLIGATYRFL